MQQKDFVPRPEDELVPWGDNLTTKLPTHQAALEISNTSITRLQTEYGAMKDAIIAVESAKRTLQSLVQTKNDAVSTFTKDVRNEAAIAKRRTGYTRAIGEDLGLEPPESSLDPTTITSAKPVFFSTHLPDAIRLDWIKGMFDGVVIERKRGNETTFSVIGRDMKSPFDDTDKNLVSDVPEIRIYRIRYILNDQLVGQWSDEIRVMANIS
ncbi:MAG: hypothetical protein HY960_02445 [Ignavibacteriae bacterium]|nr:hypothetical protein [Ignavibacteriota bacterium]